MRFLDGDLNLFKHTTVLLKEAADGLHIKPEGIYVDCTLGGAGHSSYIAKRLCDQGRLIAFDQDETAIEYAKGKLAPYGDKVTFVKSNFKHLKDKLAQLGINKVDGILYDLGVSSPQLDTAERGFSYHQDALLDMRMDLASDLSAYEVVNDWPYEDLVRIFFQYGEERFSKQIARRIEARRKEKPIETTEELVDIIKEGIPAPARRTGGHPARRVFQAIRIAVNDELDSLESSLKQAIELLRPGGRISVITFHSLEDRICKRVFREASKGPDIPRGMPVIPEHAKPPIKLINRKPIKIGRAHV